MMAQNAQGPPPPSNGHNTQYMQMQTTPTIGSTLSSNPSYQSSPNQNNGDINANKKTPKEKTPMCQVTVNLRIGLNFIFYFSNESYPSSIQTVKTYNLLELLN